jgi:hypothetical protein
MNERSKEKKGNEKNTNLHINENVESDKALIFVFWCVSGMFLRMFNLLSKV